MNETKPLTRDEVIALHVAQRVAEYTTTLAEISPAELDAAFFQALKSPTAPTVKTTVATAAAPKADRTKMAAAATQDSDPKTAASTVDMTTCACGTKFYKGIGFYLNHLFHYHLKRVKGVDQIVGYPLEKLEPLLDACGAGGTKEQKRNILSLRDGIKATYAAGGVPSAEALVDEDKSSRVYNGHDQVERAKALIRLIWNACAAVKENNMMAVPSIPWLAKVTRIPSNDWEVNLGKLSIVDHVGRVETHWLCRSLERDSFLPRVNIVPHLRTKGDSVYLTLNACMFDQPVEFFETRIENLRSHIEQESHIDWWPKYRKEHNKSTMWKPSTPTKCDKMRRGYGLWMRPNRGPVKVDIKTAPPAVAPKVVAVAKGAPASIRNKPGPGPAGADY